MPDLEPPVTIPVNEPTLAIRLWLLLQRPPGVASVKLIVVPVVTADGPVIGATTGNADTVTVAVALQPVEIVYVIKVVPAVRP